MAARTEESDTARDQTKAEQDVDMVRQRSARDQQRLDSGAVTSPKDLERLQSEIGSLARRQSALEDVVLEVMERNEAATARVADLTGQVASVEARLSETEARRDAAAEQLDSEADSVEKERQAVAAAVPDDLLALYDKLRRQHSGVGAAALFQRRCEGCRLELNITEVNDVRAAAPNEVLRCENCRRILVRTPESGL
ncbi:C4-type zinc ribbon domain-containing protein [Streptomyces sparsus]